MDDLGPGFGSASGLVAELELAVGLAPAAAWAADSEQELDFGLEQVQSGRVRRVQIVGLGMEGGSRS